MSNTIKATRVQICIFTQSDRTYEDQPKNVQAIHDAFASVVIDIQQAFNSSAPLELDICPITYNENAVIIAKHHLDPSRLPAAQVTALYPDGSRRQYFLKSGLGGIDFTAETVRPYVEALLYNRVSTPLPIICKIFPPACNVGVWLWLAMVLYAGYRTTQAKNVGKAVWGGATLLAGEAFVKRGGIDQIKSMISK